MYGCKANTRFTIRALMRKKPFVFNLLLLLCCIILFGLAIRICEAPISRVTDEMNYFYFSEAFWSVVVTFTTRIFPL